MSNSVTNDAKELTREQLTDMRGIYEAEGMRKVVTVIDMALAHIESREDADNCKRRLQAVMPLFEEARDAITCIPLATAKLRGLDLTLANRMDEVGIPEKWAAREAARKSSDGREG